MSNQTQTLRANVGTATPRGLFRNRSSLLHFGLAALLPAVILVVWQWYGASGRVSAHLLPAPTDIAKAFARLTVSGELPRQLGISLQRAAIGVFYGASAALLIGAAVGFFRPVGRLLDPFLQLLRLTPNLATAPLIILWFGFGETSKIIIIAFGSFFPLYMGVIESIRGVDNKLYEVARVLGFGKRKQLTKLIAPAALPGVLSGLRLTMAYGWLSLSHAQTSSQPAIIFVGVIIFAVMGKLIDSFVGAIENRLLRWRDSYKG